MIVLILLAVALASGLFIFTRPNPTPLTGLASIILLSCLIAALVLVAVSGHPLGTHLAGGAWN